MSTFTFKEFTIGSAVAFAAAQGPLSESASVPNWGQGATGSVDILTVAPASMAAPAGVWFEATNLGNFNVGIAPAQGEIYDPSFHEITYIWTVRGKPLPAFTAPENMVTGWNDPNLAYGKKVCFLFNDPGTYTVDLWAVDTTGATAIQEETITVLDPDDVYAGTDTICFSLNGGWAEEKPGCLRITSVHALQNALDAANAPPRVLFKRGQTVSDVDLFLDDGLLGYVGAWGTGSNPVIRPAYDKHAIQFWNSAAMVEFTVTDIDFRGGWDAATETGLKDRSPFSFFTSPTDCQYTIANCTFDGFTALWLGTGFNHSAKMVFANNVITNWQDYGIFVHNAFDDTTRFAVIGCRIMQNVAALNGGAKNGLYNNHGPLRIADMADCYFAINDFFSRNGWSGLGPDLADQPCLRFNHLATVNRSCSMDRCVCEGGFRTLAFEGQNNNTVETPSNIVLDKVLMIGTAKTVQAFIVTEFGGTTVRNTIGIMPDVPHYHGLSWKGGVLYQMNQQTAINQATPMAIYGSTFFSMRSASNDPGHTWPVELDSNIFDTVTVENNVLHAPDMDTAVTPDLPLTLAGTIPGVTPRYGGVLFNFDHESGTLSGNVSNGNSFTLDYPSGTNLAYWQTIEATDTAHMISVGEFYYAARGDFTVTFQSSNIRITNTSGVTWPAGQAWNLRLDRKSMLPGLDASYASPSAALQVPVVQTGSAGYRTADLGYQAYDDFYGTVRTSPKSAGAIEP